jgi:hypothetical protein
MKSGFNKNINTDAGLAPVRFQFSPIARAGYVRRYE